MYDKKRVLCLIDSLASGGAQRQMVGLTTLLKQKGYKVKFITYYDIPFYLQHLQKNEINYENVSYSTGLDRIRKVGSAIKCYNPDVVISYLDTPNIIACLLHIFSSSRWTLIVSERNTTQVLSLRERLKFALFRFADWIVPNSYSQKDFLAIHYPRYDKKCHVITNFVDTDFFTPKRQNSTSSILRIIGVGRVSRQKNIPLLIEAVRVIREKGRFLRVDWYGAQLDTYEECSRLVLSYNLEDCFVFHGPDSNVLEKYQESDLFVLPSIYEGFPNVLCEAMSCGLPVIVSDVCDNGHIVKHKENGYLFPSGDLDKLVEGILQFMNLPLENRVLMGEKSRLFAVQLFSKETFVQEYISLIN